MLFLIKSLYTIIWSNFLSLLLFTLTIEHLALQICQNYSYKRIQIAPSKDSIGLYADDMVLFIPQPNTLQDVMNLINTFGVYSRLLINWHPLKARIWSMGDTFHILQIVSLFKYLGITMPRDSSLCYDLYIYPLLVYFWIHLQPESLYHS